MSTNLAKRLEALRDHEWDLSHDERWLICSTCLAKHRANSRVSPKHKTECLYAEMITEIVNVIEGPS